VREFTVVGAEPLLRLLTRQPLDIEPDLGQRPVLPPREPVVPAVGYPIVAGRVRNSDLLDTNIIRAVRAADELAGTSALDVSALLDVGVTSVSAQRIARALLATVPDRSGPVLLERINACEVTGPAWHRAAEAAELFSPAHCSLVEDDLAGVLSGSVERTRHVITALGRVGATSQAEAVAKKADVYTSKLGTCAATALTRMFQASMADGAVGAPIRDAVARTLHGFLLRHPSTAWVLRFDFLTLTPLHADPCSSSGCPRRTSRSFGSRPARSGRCVCEGRAGRWPIAPPVWKPATPHRSWRPSAESAVETRWSCSEHDPGCPDSSWWQVKVLL
jgi:hypothetical protein